MTLVIIIILLACYFNCRYDATFQDATHLAKSCHMTNIVRLSLFISHGDANATSASMMSLIPVVVDLAVTVNAVPFFAGLCLFEAVLILLVHLQGA